MLKFRLFQLAMAALVPGLLISSMFAADGKALSDTDRQRAIDQLFAGQFKWTAGAPLVAPVRRLDDSCISVKDPTIVHFEGWWHLFCTIRSQKRSHQIEYLSFTDWKDADKAPRHILKINPGYFCAPQVFYFTPQRKWYLIHQVNDEARKILQPAYSTSTNIADPNSWSVPAWFYSEHPD